MEIPNPLKVSRTFLTRCCLIQPIVRQLAKHAVPLALLWNRFCLFMDMVVTCGQHMAHVIQYNPFNNCRITIRLKTCECVRVSQRTNHARGAVLRRSPGVAFPPCYKVSRAWARVFYALLCLSHDYSRSTKFWVKICVLFLSICSDLSLHFNFLYVEEGLRQTSRFSYLRRTHGS